MKNSIEGKKARDIIRRLTDEGWEAYIVGGAARDLLAGEIPSDYDVATNAPFEAVKKIFRNRKTAVVGVSFKICIVDGIEVATYRKSGGFEPGDIGERAETLIEDLSRRDLTINAMAFNPQTGEIVDVFGGKDDLKNRIIRFTGNPADRIMEDPCRMIRACRFKAKFKGHFDPDTQRAIMDHKDKTGTVAPERIRLELLKTMDLESPGLFFDTLHDTGLLAHVSPGLDACYGVEGGPYHNETVGEHFTVVGDVLPKGKPLLRLAGYYHDVGKPRTFEFKDGKISFIHHEKEGADIAAEELKNLKFSLKETGYITALVRHHMREIKKDDKPKTVRKLLKKLADDGVFWKDWLRLKIADRKGNRLKTDYTPMEIRDIVMKIRRELHPPSGKPVLTIKELAVDGKDVMNVLGIPEGPEVGTVLAGLLELVLEYPEKNIRTLLINHVKEKRR